MMHPRLLAILALVCTLPLALSVGAAPALAKSPNSSKKKAKKPRIFTTTSINIEPPQMMLPSDSTRRPPSFRGKVHVQIKLVYAYAGQPKDQRFVRSIPGLGRLKGFSAFRPMGRFKRDISHRQVINLRISQKYKIVLSPKGYEPNTKRLLLRASFFYRKTVNSRLQSYASIDLRVKNGKRIAFVGPPHLSGRTLLILFAKHIPTKKSVKK